jgi:hypothetical protein
MAWHGAEWFPLDTARAAKRMLRLVCEGMIMSTPAFSLHYVQTADDMRADFQRMRRDYGRSWFRIAAALLTTWMAISSVTSGYGWSSTLITTLAAMYFWVSPSPLIWLLYYGALIRCSDLKVTIEIDKQSIVSHREDRKSGYRQSWPRLSRIDEFNHGYELTFDDQSYAPMQVPFKAFVDDAQRHQFCEFLTRHAPPTAEWQRRSTEQ